MLWCGWVIDSCRHTHCLQKHVCQLGGDTQIALISKSTTNKFAPHAHPPPPLHCFQRRPVWVNVLLKMPPVVDVQLGEKQSGIVPKYPRYRTHTSSPLHDYASAPPTPFSLAETATRNHAPPPRKVWNTSTGDELLTLDGHRNVVYAIAFNNPWGDKIITGSFDKTCKLWNAEVHRYMGPVVSRRILIFSSSANI